MTLQTRRGRNHRHATPGERSSFPKPPTSGLATGTAARRRSCGPNPVRTGSSTSPDPFARCAVPAPATDRPWETIPDTTRRPYPPLFVGAVLLQHRPQRRSRIQGKNPRFRGPPSKRSSGRREKAGIPSARRQQNRIAAQRGDEVNATLSEGPALSDRKAMRVPSGEIVGSLSSAGSRVRRMGSPAPICCTQISRLPSLLRSEAKARRLPSRDRAGNALRPGVLVTRRRTVASAVAAGWCRKR